MTDKIGITNKLSYKQAKLTVIIALALGMALSAVQIIVDFNNEQSRLDATVMQALDTVQESASQAAYGLENRLAERVVSGLFEYEPIVRAEISVDIGGLIAASDRTNELSEHGTIANFIFDDDSDVYSIDLRVEGHPASVGALTVWVHPHLAFSDFFNRISITLALGFVRSFILAAILMAAFYFLLTKRLVRITSASAKLTPRTLKTSKLICRSMANTTNSICWLAHSIFISSNKNATLPRFRRANVCGPRASNGSRILPSPHRTGFGKRM